MFSLIITIISIALVAALALATLYFGGDAFNQGSAKAAASTLVNQASQISGANTLYFLDNQTYGTVSDLTANDGEYLASAPNPGEAGDDYSVDTDGSGVSGSSGGVISTNVSVAVCEAVNKQAGMDTADAMPADLASTSGYQFACFGPGDDTNTFVFK